MDDETKIWAIIGYGLLMGALTEVGYGVEFVKERGELPK